MVVQSKLTLLAMVALAICAAIAIGASSLQAETDTQVDLTEFTDSIHNLQACLQYKIHAQETHAQYMVYEWCADVYDIKAGCEYLAYELWDERYQQGDGEGGSGQTT